MFRRGFVAAMVGVTAALIVGLSAVSLAGEIRGSTGAAIQSMGISLGGIVGVLIAAGTLLVQTGRRGIGSAAFAIGTVAAVLFLVWASRHVPEAPTLVLSASDRADLREYHDALGVRGVEHPTLGFRLPHPTLALETSAEIVEETRAVSAPGWAEAHQMWAFETHDRSVSVVADLSRAERADRESLASFERANVGPLEANGHTVERGDVVGEPGCLREPFVAHLSNGGRVDGLLFVFDDGARSLRLVITVVSDGTGDWAHWTRDVTLACERLAR